MAPPHSLPVLPKTHPEEPHCRRITYAIVACLDMSSEKQPTCNREFIDFSEGILTKGNRLELRKV